ncbi:MAG: TIGR00266 family protein [Anaerolineae bacterium]|nr:TIGR00266 family protein [Anaerolineae bacterium]
MSSHIIDYHVFGDDMQFVEVELDPAETVIAEAGVMMYMESGITFETKMGDGSKPTAGFMDKLVSVGKRVFTGESIFMTHFTNSAGSGKQHVAFAAPYPGKIIAIDLDEAHGELLCQKNAFLAAALGTEISIAFNKKIGAGLFGGEGFILQKLRGDGMVFIHAGGTIVEKRLNNEKILVDTGCLVAFENTISYNIEQAGNLKSMIFGGEGLFLATLQGTGRIWLQSLPFSRLADRILQNAPSQGGQQVDEGSVIRGFTKLMGN